MRPLIPVLFLATSLLAPAAWTQTAGPSIPAAAPGGTIESAKPTPRVVKKKRTARAAVHKTKAVTRAKAPARRAPAKQAVIAGSLLV